MRNKELLAHIMQEIRFTENNIKSVSEMLCQHKLIYAYNNCNFALDRLNSLKTIILDHDSDVLNDLRKKFREEMTKK